MKRLPPEASMRIAGASGGRIGTHESELRRSRQSGRIFSFVTRLSLRLTTSKRNPWNENT